MNIRKNKLLTFLSLLLISVISFVISVTSLCSNENVVLAQDDREQVYEEDFVYDSIIVVLDSSISAVNKVHSKEFFNGVEIDYIKDLTYRNYNKTVNADFKQILQLFLVNKTRQGVLYAIETLKNLEGVFSVEPNYYCSVQAVPNEDTYSSGTFLWGLKEGYGINATQAWNITTGSKDIRVGIIDSGIEFHNDLIGNLVTGYDFENNNNITNDGTNPHGTRVAGIIGATWNNGGTAGVCKDVTLVPLQTSYDGEHHRAQDVIAAIQWAQDRWGTEEEIDIINYSVGGFGESTTVREAVRQYHGLFVWATGNENEDVDTRIAENDSFILPNLISVSGYNQDGQRLLPSDFGSNSVKGANYSTSGINVDIYAPGAYHYTTSAGNNYSRPIGTSMAAPFVSGVAALMLSYNPTLTASELKSKILSGADDITITLPGGSKQSVKKLNAYNAVVLSQYKTTTLAGSKVKIDGFINKGFREIEIPSSLGGCEVSEIDYMAFSGHTELTSVVLPTTITSIGDNAFMGCTGLTTINLGGATTIGKQAFQNCVNLSNITGFNGAVNIEELAFLNCNSLQSITIPSTTTYVGAGAFAGCNNLSIISNSLNYTADANILYNADESVVITSGDVGQNVKILESVTEIGEYAFYNSEIESVIIEGCPMILNYAFANCSNLSEITFYSESVPYIEVDAFDNKEYDLAVPEGAIYDYEEVFADIADDASIRGILFQLPLVCSITGNTLGYASAYYREQVILDFVPTLTHYEFYALTEKPNGDGKVYVLKSDFLDSSTHQIMCESTNQIWTEKGAGTLYVHWEKLDKYVSYDVVYINESTQSPRSVFIRSGEQTTITAPTIDGYTFDHWTIHNTNYTSASQSITVTLHRSYVTGQITIQNPANSMQDAVFQAHYNKIQQSGGGECVAQGTLVTLADGSQVPVESLTGNERLLVWNLKTGRFDTAPILFIDHEEAKVYEIINLYFSDGTHVKVIDEHAFWDFNLNKYVYLRSDASNYIGHYFNKQVVDENGVMTWTSVQLVNVTITDEYTTAWSPVTYEHLCLYVNGMLSMPGGIEGLVNTYEVDATTMKIDQALYLQDVQTYGLFTYEEFYELYQVPREMFDAVDGANLKVAIGKGYIGYQTIAQLIERYAVFFE